MKLTAVVMIKNEIDVIRDCCGHLSALFDTVIIIDHRSTDGTKEYLVELEKLNKKFHIYYLTEPGYYQSQVMTWIVKNLEACTGADWVFLIDADEVLPFLSRSEFEQVLNKFESSAIIRMPWSNLVPEEYSSKSIMGRSYLEPKVSTIFHKIAFQPSLIPVSDFMIAQGNHAVLAGGYGKELPSVPAFKLYHVPIRSKNQLGFKIIQGTASYSMMGEERNESLGSHWFDISRHITKYGMSDELLNGLVFRYGEPMDKNNINIPYERLLEVGCQKTLLDYAYESLPEISHDIDDIEKIIKMLSDFQASSSGNMKRADVVKLNGNKELIFMGATNTPFFNTLPDKEHKDAAEVDFEFLVQFLAPATAKIESFTPTSWGGHIPFLFCLIACLRPRVYAELGSHYGASYFAACQAMQLNKPSGQAIAIDLWKGDEHAGFYGESVFRDFQYILRTKYSDVGEYLRMSFDDASRVFANQSVDLLHIDGLHTYEAVKNDYETWRSKVTNNGVIIFHDTNVFDRGFGVGKLWKEISAEAVSFEFKHTHGLGVMAFGSPDENPIVRLLTMINNSQILSDYFESFFSRVGELTNNEAIADINKSTDRGSSSGVIQTKIRPYKNAIRNRLVHFVKSVPILRRTAFYLLRFVRR
jgi:glycosyltransferase involved in cell wall biosynthesis